MKDLITTRIANKLMTPLAKFAGANRGAIKEIHERLCKRTKKKWNRANVERWLHSDEEKRTQPLMGVGLLLAEIGAEVQAEFEAKKGEA